MNKLYFEYYVPSIPMYNTGVCQTDGRTDGRTYGRTDILSWHNPRYAYASRGIKHSCTSNQRSGM